MRTKLQEIIAESLNEDGSIDREKLSAALKIMPDNPVTLLIEAVLTIQQKVDEQKDDSERFAVLLEEWKKEILLNAEKTDNLSNTLKTLHGEIFAGSDSLKEGLKNYNEELKGLIKAEKESFEALFKQGKEVKAAAKNSNKSLFIGLLMGMILGGILGAGVLILIKALSLL